MSGAQRGQRGGERQSGDRRGRDGGRNQADKTAYIERVVAINRMGAATIPSTRTVAQAGDVLYIAAETARLTEIDAALETPRKGH